MGVFACFIEVVFDHFKEGAFMMLGLGQHKPKRVKNMMSFVGKQLLHNFQYLRY